MIKTIHQYRGYVFTIAKQPAKEGWKVRFSDIPTIITSGETLANAFTNACEALDLYLDALKELGRSFPKPKHRLIVKALGA